MKKILPIILILLFFGMFFVTPKVHGQVPPPAQQLQQAPVAPDGSWVVDPEVTFIGKNAARSGNLLDFTLENYNWVCVKQDSNGQCDNRNNPLAAVWLTTVTFIVVPLLFVVVLAAAIIIIVTRGRSVTVMRFLPRFVAIVLLIFFSFALIQFIYQFIDVIQGFFLRSGNNSCPSIKDACISQKDLLFVGWKYQTFEGLRKTGPFYTESAFISLLLTKLTALTYYVMVGILFLRRIILWLFIIVSPIFPILLMFYPVRNTGKIWIGEFFRWLLYAPLFAIFLKGLVSLWRNGIPLVFNTISRTDTSQQIYPTAVNILLGGPKEFVTPDNSVNLTETFALYVVSLLMLWGVIILPWILLQIFLEYASKVGLGDNVAIQKMMSMVNNRKSPPPVSPSTPPASGGSAISLPFTKKFNLPIAPPAPTGMARELPISVSQTSINKSAYMPTAQVKAQVLSLTNMSLPSMRDIAKYDTSLISRDKDRQKEVTVIKENLEKIANPASISSTTERERFTDIREKLTQESKGGNTLASSIISAASTVSKRSSQANTNQLKNILTQIANPSSVNNSSASSALRSSSASSSTSAMSSIINKSKLENMNQSLVKAKKEGNSLAASILAVTDKTPPAEIEKLSEKIRDARLKGEPIATQIAAVAAKSEVAALPVVNRVQTVSKEDYQAVKDMWKDNYRNLEVPEGMAGTRAEWIKEDMTKIENIINLLSSKDEEQRNVGMQEVSSILPFLLVGGFSQTEIIAYLKAKQEAAKDVAVEVLQDEDDKVEVKVKKTATTTQQMSASISEDTGDNDQDNESSLSNLSSTSTSSTGVNQVSNEILSLVNIKLPSIRDIARYEAVTISKDKSKTTEVEKAHKVLSSIANPQSISDISDRQRYEKIKEKLVEESKKGNIMAVAILSAASGIIPDAAKGAPSDTKSVLSQIANPSLVISETNKKRFTNLHDQLNQASKDGNPLAVSLLSVKETASKEEIERLNIQLKLAKDSGDVLADSVLSNIAPVVSLPSTNRVQTVSKEDYQAVKDMWRDNYTNLEVPEGMAGTRAEWIKDDVSKIENIVSLLSSADQTQVTQGMNEVSSILPFLLVGGFSQTEIVSYLNAKQDAAKDVLTVINNEEDSTVSIERKKTETQVSKTMTVSQEVSSSTSDFTQQLPVDGNSMLTKQISNETLKLANLELPRLSDIVSYETRNLTKDKKESERIEKIHSVLEKLGNPASISMAPERQQYETLQQKLSEERQKGNVTADVIMSAATQMKHAAGITMPPEELKKVFKQIKTPLFAISPKSHLQEVTPEEYQAAHELWENAYKQYFIPEGYTQDVKGRIEWIKKDIVDIEETIDLLQSSDESQKENGLKKISSILPFLLLGGFSLDEMITYLKTKLDAAQSALSAIESNEENSVQADATKNETVQSQELSEKIPEDDDQKK